MSSRSGSNPLMVVILVVGAVLLVAGIIFSFTCLIPPYNKPKFQELEANQTAFLIPMDGDTDTQKKTDNAELMKERKVGGQRIQIPRNWRQTGFFPANGEYQDTLRLVVVSHSPMTRTWAREAEKGTPIDDDAIQATSKDGTKFHLGFTVTAYVEANEAHNFLYYYRDGDLSRVMDKEMRGRVTGVLTLFCSKMNMDELRGHQSEMVDAVVKNLEFFKTRGITVTNAGLDGGFNYDNPEVQKAIDQTFKDQQLKVSAEAKREAQQINNQTVKLEAEGKAEAIKVEAEARASATKTEADAADYQLKKLGENKEFYLLTRKMEIEEKKNKLWDGKWPHLYFAGGNATPLFEVPAEMLKPPADKPHGK